MATPGRPRSIDGASIARAVVAVGFESLTFAAVAERLGVGQSTLFRYTPTRDELVLAGLDRVVEQIDWPPLDQPWRELLASYAMAAWEAWGAHPGAATEAARGIVPPRMMRLLRRVAAQLAEEGFDADQAVLACDIVFDLVADNRRGLEMLDRPVPGGVAPRERFRTAWQADRSVDADGEGRAIDEALARAVGSDPRRWVTQKLGIVIAGIAATIAPGA